MNWKRIVERGEIPLELHACITALERRDASKTKRRREYFNNLIDVNYIPAINSYLGDDVSYNSRTHNLPSILKRVSNGVLDALQTFSINALMGLEALYDSNGYRFALKMAWNWFFRWSDIGGMDQMNKSYIKRYVQQMGVQFGEDAISIGTILSTYEITNDDLLKTPRVKDVKESGSGRASLDHLVTNVDWLVEHFPWIQHVMKTFEGAAHAWIHEFYGQAFILFTEWMTDPFATIAEFMRTQSGGGPNSGLVNRTVNMEKLNLSSNPEAEAERDAVTEALGNILLEQKKSNTTRQSSYRFSDRDTLFKDATMASELMVDILYSEEEDNDGEIFTVKLDTLLKSRTGLKYDEYVGLHAFLDSLLDAEYLRIANTLFSDIGNGVDGNDDDEDDEDEPIIEEEGEGGELTRITRPKTIPKSIREQKEEDDYKLLRSGNVAAIRKRQQELQNEYIDRLAEYNEKARQVRETMKEVGGIVLAASGGQDENWRRTFAVLGENREILSSETARIQNQLWEDMGMDWLQRRINRFGAYFNQRKRSIRISKIIRFIVIFTIFSATMVILLHFFVDGDFLGDLFGGFRDFFLPTPEIRETIASRAASSSGFLSGVWETLGGLKQVITNQVIVTTGQLPVESRAFNLADWWYNPVERGVAERATMWLWRFRNMARVAPLTYYGALVIGQTVGLRVDNAYGEIQRADDGYMRRYYRIMTSRSGFSLAAFSALVYALSYPLEFGIRASTTGFWVSLITGGGVASISMGFSILKDTAQVLSLPFRGVLTPATTTTDTAIEELERMRNQILSVNRNDVLALTAALNEYGGMAAPLQISEDSRVRRERSFISEVVSTYAALPGNENLDPTIIRPLLPSPAPSPQIPTLLPRPPPQPAVEEEEEDELTEEERIVEEIRRQRIEDSLMRLRLKEAIRRKKKAREKKK